VGVVAGLVWTQFLYVWSFEEYIKFEQVIDVGDQWSDDYTYQNFIHRDAAEHSSLFEVYLFNVSSPESMIDEGFKPRVQEVGPYGYIKNHFKYDVHFSHTGSTGINDNFGDKVSPSASYLMLDLDTRCLLRRCQKG